MRHVCVYVHIQNAEDKFCQNFSLQIWNTVIVLYLHKYVLSLLNIFRPARQWNIIWWSKEKWQSLHCSLHSIMYVSVPIHRSFSFAHFLHGTHAEVTFVNNNRILSKKEWGRRTNKLTNWTHTHHFYILSWYIASLFL